MLHSPLSYFLGLWSNSSVLAVILSDCGAEAQSPLNQEGNLRPKNKAGNPIDYNRIYCREVTYSDGIEVEIVPTVGVASTPHSDSSPHKEGFIIELVSDT